MRALRPVLPGAALEVDRRAEPAAARAPRPRPRCSSAPRRSPYGSGCRRSRSAAVGGASDGNFTAGVGTPTLDGLGAVGGGAHADDEHVLVDELPGRTRAAGRAGRRPAGDPLPDERLEPTGAHDHDEPGEREQHGCRDQRDDRRADVDLDRPSRRPTRPRGGRCVGARARPTSPSSTRWSRLFATIWGRDGNPPVTLELLRAFTKAGNYVGGAFDGDARWSARASASSTRRPRTRCTATSPASSPGVGRSQRRLRAQAAPARVGAAARRLRDRLDLRPAGQPQRLLQPGQARRRSRSSTCRTSTARCSTASTATTTPTGCSCAGGCATPRSSSPARRQPPVGRRRRARRRCRRRARRRGRRRARAAAGWTARPSLVAVPRDIEALRAADPALAQRWRVAVREALVRAARRRRRGSPASTGPAGTSSARRRCSMKLTGVELRRVAMPLVSPFRTSFGTQTARDILLLRVVTDEAEGWGECVAMADPLYSSEYVDGAADVLRRFFVPALAAAGAARRARGRDRARSRSRGTGWPRPRWRWRVLDAELRAQGRSFARELGAVHDRVPCGVSVGIMDSIPAAARRRRRLPRRGLRPDQAEDRARLGRRAGARGARAVRRRRAAPGRREHGVHAAPTPATWPGSTRSTCC